MTVSPAAFIATDQPDQSFAVSPSISAPTCTHPVSQREHPSLTRTIAVAVVEGAPMMTVSPAAFIATDQPELSFAVSPSISAPTCTHPLVSQREHPGMTRIIAVAVVERAPMMTVSPAAFIATDIAGHNRLRFRRRYRHRPAPTHSSVNVNTRA